VIGGYLPLEKVYQYEPVPPELSVADGRYILGAQANIWTEYMTSPSKIEYMIFPRVDALSEVLWSPRSSKNWTSFKKKLTFQFERYNLWATHYFSDSPEYDIR
jgi:hexosaminidase